MYCMQVHLYHGVRLLSTGSVEGQPGPLISREPDLIPTRPVHNVQKLTETSEGATGGGGHAVA